MAHRLLFLKHMKLLALGALAAIVLGCASPVTFGQPDEEDNITSSKKTKKSSSKDAEESEENDSIPNGDDATSAKKGLTFGTLNSVVEHNADEAKAGITHAEIDFGWDSFEPQPHVFNDAYGKEMLAKVDAFRKAGRSVTLGIALHYTPRWVYDAVPNSRFIDDEGKSPSDDGHPNIIFNQKMRLLVEEMFARAANVLDFSLLDSIRITSGPSGELLYPSSGSYMAFDVNAQNGPDMPPTMKKNPLPGWKPGQAGKSAAEMRSWVDWYLGGLVDSAVWQMDTFTKLGFKGSFELLTPGMGMRPWDVDDAIANRVPHGLLAVGPAWEAIYRQLPRRKNIVAYVSSVADELGDKNDVCTAADAQVTLTSREQASNWSSPRWLARIAREFGYAVRGENPGFSCPSCAQNPELDAAYKDLGERGMMAAAFRQVKTCNYERFYWAHSENLWNGTIPFKALADSIATSKDKALTSSPQ